MEILFLALENIRRRLSRNLMVALALAIFTLIFITTLTISTSLESAAHLSWGGEIQVWGKGASLPVLSSIPENYSLPIRELPYVKEVSPMITAITPMDSTLIITLGIVPRDTHLLPSYRMVEGAMINDNGSNAVIGVGLANKIGKHINDTVTFGNRGFKIIGVIESSSWMDYIVIISLKAAQEAFRMVGDVSIITVSVTDITKIDLVIEEIEGIAQGGGEGGKGGIGGLEAFRIQETPAKIAPFMSSVQWMTTFLIVVTAVAIFLGITITILINLAERTREMGVLKALGAKRRDVFRILIYESAILGLGGGLLGLVMASAVISQGVSLSLGYGLELPLHLYPPILILGLASSLTISIISTLYPAWRIVRIRPQEVLRFG